MSQRDKSFGLFNLVLVRDEMSPTLRFNIEERKVIYEGKIIHTPLLKTDD